VKRINLVLSDAVVEFVYDGVMLLLIILRRQLLSPNLIVPKLLLAMAARKKTFVSNIQAMNST
jgi:hypothetical protein